MHLVGILFPHINDGARSKSHQSCFPCLTTPKYLIILSHNNINSFVYYLVFLFIRSFCAIPLLLIIYLFTYLLLTVAREKVKKYFVCPVYETYRGSWLTSRPARFIPETKHRCILNKEQCGLQSRFGPCGKEETSDPCRDSKPRSSNL